MSYISVRNDGGYTVQNTAGAVTTTPDCPPQSATVLLGPSAMQNGGARILAALDPCILTDGTVILNLPDEKGIHPVGNDVFAIDSMFKKIQSFQGVKKVELYVFTKIGYHRDWIASEIDHRLIINH